MRTGAPEKRPCPDKLPLRKMLRVTTLGTKPKSITKDPHKSDKFFESNEETARSLDDAGHRSAAFLSDTKPNSGLARAQDRPVRFVENCETRNTISTHDLDVIARGGWRALIDANFVPPISICKQSVILRTSDLHKYLNM